MIKKLKPVIALLVACCTIFSQIAVVSADNSEKIDDFALLKGLGIAKTDADIAAVATRADLAHVGLGLINRLNEFENVNISEIYSDVEENASQIYGAYVNGIMVGDDSGKFNPDDVITKEMITVVMGRVCGYGGIEASEWINAGFEEYNLYKKVKLSNPVTLGELYAVAQNCLEEKILSVKPSYDRYGNYVNAYEKTGETVLQYYFDVYEGKGIVESNSVSGLVSAAMNCKVNTVKINNIIYDVGTTNASELFGLNCDFYYMEREDNDPLLISIEKNEKVEMLVIDSKDVIGYANKQYTYEQEERVKHSDTIAETASIMYNGKPLSNPTDAIFNAPDWYGEVILIDNFGKGSYDVVFIYSYTNYIVGSVDTKNNTIYDIVHNTSVNLGQDEGYDFDIYINGKKGTFADIGLDATASVFTAEDGYKLVYVYREVFSSKLESVDTAANEIIVDGIVYKVQDHNAMTEAKNHLGDTVKIYLDGAKRISYIDFNVSISGEMYAILTNLKIMEEDILRMKLFMQDGEFKTVFTGDKFILNGKSVKITKGSAGWSELWDDGQSDNRKLVKVIIEEDIIKEVKTAVEAEYNDIYNSKAYTDFRRVYRANNSNKLYYKTAGTHFVNIDTAISPIPTTFETSAQTVVFVLPESVNAEESYYALGSMNQFVNNERVATDMYRGSDSKAIDVMVIRGQESRTTDNSKTLVVNKVNDIVNEDDEIVVSITGIVNQKADQTLLVKANDSFTFSDGKTLEEYARSLNKGDFLTYRTNTKGEVIYFEKMFDGETKIATIPSNITVDTAMAMYGQVRGYKDGIVTVYDGVNDIELSYKYSGNVLIHDSDTKTQRVGTVAELVYGKNVCLYVQESRVRMAIIYQ